MGLFEVTTTAYCRCAPPTIAGVDSAAPQALVEAVVSAAGQSRQLVRVMSGYFPAEHSAHTPLMATCGAGQRQGRAPTDVTAPPFGHSQTTFVPVDAHGSPPADTETDKQPLALNAEQQNQLVAVALVEDEYSARCRERAATAEESSKAPQAGFVLYFPADSKRKPEHDPLST